MSIKKTFHVVQYLCNCNYYIISTCDIHILNEFINFLHFMINKLSYTNYSVIKKSKTFKY